jgi:alkanesulfonate monooxygenase SsuD/methylene tetrahydromethanopterin reductase-like flavin-dependent oxidoreductase (luciferase family)
MADMASAAQGTRTGLALRDPIPWHDFVQVVETAEQAGYETLFVPEIAGREAFATLAALAGRTEALRLGTGVVPVPARRVSTLAMAAATVQELSGNRLVLGVGSGHPDPASLDRVASAVRALRSAFAGAPLHEGFVLALKPERPPPIWLAALGDRMIALAGEVADGVLLNWCNPSRVARARELVGEGAVRAGRDPASVTVGVYVRACLGHEDDVALAALRAAAVQYASMPHYRRQMEEMGLGDAARSAADAQARGRPDEVPEELVRELCLMGEPHAAGERLQGFRDAGADLPVVYPIPAREPVSSIIGTALALAPAPAIQP